MSRFKSNVISLIPFFIALSSCAVADHNNPGIQRNIVKGGTASYLAGPLPFRSLKQWFGGDFDIRAIIRPNGSPGPMPSESPTSAPLVSPRPSNSPSLSITPNPSPCISPSPSANSFSTPSSSISPSISPSPSPDCSFYERKLAEARQLYTKLKNRKMRTERSKQDWENLAEDKLDEIRDKDKEIRRLDDEIENRERSVQEAERDLRRLPPPSRKEQRELKRSIKSDRNAIMRIEKEKEKEMKTDDLIDLIREHQRFQKEISKLEKELQKLEPQVEAAEQSKENWRILLDKCLRGEL